MVVDSYRFAAAGGFTDPTDITWKALYWVGGPEFTALSLSNGAEVTTWPDEAGTADATKATTGPTYAASDAQFNSQPVVNTTDITHLLSSTLPSTTSHPFTIVAIAQSTTVDTNSRFGLGSPSNAVGIITSSTSSGAWRVRSPTLIAYGNTAFAGSDTNAHLLEGVFNSTACAVREDGTQIGATGDAGSTALATDFRLQINVVGKWALIGVYDGIFHDDASYSDFKTWASTTYGLTIA